MKTQGPTVLSIQGEPGQERRAPKIGPDCFIAPTAAVVGDVTMGRNCSVWFNAVIRGDVMPIVIGDETNIQDGSVIHGTYKKCGAKIGNRVTVGHSVILHGCEIGDRCLIGMGSIIMDQAKVSADSLVAAGSLITEGSEFPPGVLIMGRPAKVKRELTPEEIKFLNQSADNYIHYKTWYGE
jgi:carbonic anhydrase/acetyltransferase-like protein (isoleucine patch superfamily)